MQTGWLLVGGGVLVAVVSGAWLLLMLRFRRRAARALGVVVKMDKFGGRWGTMGAPTFRFETPDRREWTVESIVGTSPPLFRVGQSVAVIYDAADPAGARIDGMQLWLGPGIGFAISLLLCAAGLLAF